ncbi:RNA 2'-phosphotransferase [Amycolatopsis taiwanensis]|uniref:Probable RNA 2'-phosphotransferase n=1 Tax=Amycolatopsis taiwanensis TaxID=342230 RepID=A0A9W6QTS3_9PSEU|nr:RNA 2'-phosphotransferase [Amycolatopsis taiwanensis]GLY63603.1 putative RNA 2'-phosphotransferase [Amycolatopsis taiwanensis]
MTPSLVRISKFLSLVLRHDPARIGLRLDPAGWADIDELLDKAAAAGTPITRETLLQVVEQNNKQRFALDSERNLIRANQGHSIDVDLGLAPLRPPEELFHGTGHRFVEAIRREGIDPRGRHHVHLSSDVETATTVGRRHGRPVVLLVDAGRMHADGHVFYRSDNGVWLTDAVPPHYLCVVDTD